MELICNNKTFQITDILKTSKTLNDMIQINSNSSKVELPQKYYQALTLSNPTSLDSQIELLKLYDFLNVDSKYIQELSHSIGSNIESSDEDYKIEKYLLSTIINYYPSLYFKYQGADLPVSFKIEIKNNKYKYTSPTYHQRNNLKFKLFDYCRFGNLEMVKFLNKENLQSCFLIACEYGHLEIVQYLFKLGCKIDLSCISKVCIFGHLDTLKFLFEHSDNQINSTLLEFACANGHLNIVQYFHEITPHNIFEGFRFRALVYACDNGNFELVKYIFPLRKYSQEELHIAGQKSTLSKKLDILKYLHQNGLNLDDDEKFIRNPTMLKNYEMVEYLIKNGKCVKYDGNNIYDFISKSSLKIIQLIDQYRIIDYKKISIYYAIKNGDENLIEFLHQKGTGVVFNINDISNAIERGNLVALKYFYKIRQESFDSYYIKYAIIHNQLEIVKFLHEIGCDIRMEHDTCMKIATRLSLNLVKYLHENGVPFLDYEYYENDEKVKPEILEYIKKIVYN